MPRIPFKNLTRSDEMAEKLEMSTAEIGLSVRTTNCLEEKGIFTVHDLLHCTRADLLSISNFGEKTLEEVYRALEKIGFYRSSPAVPNGVGTPRTLSNSDECMREEKMPAAAHDAPNEETWSQS